MMHGCLRRTRLTAVLKYAVVLIFAYYFVIVLYTQLSTSVYQPQDVSEGQHSRYGSYYRPIGLNTSQCQSVHVATWCHDVDTTRDVVSMLHTLLYHRTSALQLHLVVSNSSHTTLKLLFDTWQLPSVNIHFYVQPLADLQVLSQEPQGHYKILARLPTFLPGDLEKVIYASSKLRFLDDIAKLWHAFDTSRNWVASLAANPHDLLPVPWMPVRPPLSNHMILFDLAVINWQQFRNYANERREEMLQEFRPEVVVRMSCSWSIPLDLPTTQLSVWKRCLKPAQGLLWGDQASHFSGSALLENAKQRTLNILNSNGDLQRTTSLCGGIHTEPVDQSDQPLTATCSEYSYAVRSKRRVHLNFLGASTFSVQSDEPFDISMATQFTVDRLYMFERFAQNWEGPIIAVVYATDAEARQLATGVQQSAVLNKRKNIVYHVAYKKQYYPINLLRNLALNHTHTPYVIFVDVDLIPMPSMYQLLKDRLRELSKSQPPHLLPVIPAFEAFDQLGKFPKNKDELLDLMETGSVDGYRMKKGWNLGHRATNYPKWKTTNTSYVVQWEDAFEPYVVLPVKNIPLYHEPLLERMGDKIAYGLMLYAMGYDFLILPDVFVIHLPHRPSDGTNTWKHSPTYSRCGSHLFQAFKADLRRRYPERKIR